MGFVQEGKSLYPITDALGSVVALSDKAGGKERRRADRVDVQTREPLSIFSKGLHLPAVPIMVRDVSPRGINILYPEPLP